MGVYTPNGDTFVPTFTQLADGDEPKGATFDVVTETIANQVAWLKRRVLVIGDMRDTSNNGPSALVFPFGLTLTNQGPRFAWQSDYSWLQTSVADAGALVFEMQAPVFDNSGSVLVPKCYLTDAGIYLLGGAGAGHAAGGMPATKPSFALKAIDAQGNIAVVFAQTFDPETNYTLYDAVHHIGLTGLNPGIDVTGKRLVLEITGETGGGSVASTTKFLGGKILCCCNPT